MIFLSLLVCVVLGALSAQARVVTDFHECSHFFFEGQEPAGMDQNGTKICQMFEDDDYFATLYSVSNRIPVYSAYMFNNPKRSVKEEFYDEDYEEECTNRRSLQWFIEPQLSRFSRPSMSQETEFSLNSIKRNQAIKADYLKSGFDRGHLNPNAFQRGDGQSATHTLTNAAPTDPSFNRMIWRAWEDGLHSLLSNLDTQVEANAYLVTGAVPSQNYRIPQGAQINEGEDAKRVKVPTHIWTALCYKHMDDTKSFSLGFIGENKPDGVVRLMTVEDLNAVLGMLYESSVLIFKDDCFSNNNKSEEVRKELSAKIEVPQTERLKMVLDSFKETQFQGSTRKSKMSPMQHANETSLFQLNEKMKKNTGNVHMITGVTEPKSGNQRKKRDFKMISFASNLDTAADGTHCNNDLHFCETDEGFKLYCTEPCVYNEHYKGYRCQSGGDSVECSPKNTRLTVSWKSCKDDYPCATYGKDFYWCWTDDGSWDYCSPPEEDTKTLTGHLCRNNHACSKYGKRYYWCYTDVEDNWDYCCERNDPFLSLKGKTCSKPCGYHGEDYLWCHTTDGSWDYCCVIG